jgi:hypothetical protein
MGIIACPSSRLCPKQDHTHAPNHLQKKEGACMVRRKIPIVFFVFYLFYDLVLWVLVFLLAQCVLSKMP